MTVLLHFYWPLLAAALLIGIASGMLAFRSRRVPVGVAKTEER